MRFLGFVIVMAALVTGVGYYRGWFIFSRGDRTDDKVSVTVQVDSDKIKSDAAFAKQRARELGGAVTGTKTTHGKLHEVTENRIVVVTDSGDSMVFHSEPESKVTQIDSDARWMDLKAGSRVTIVHREQDGKNLVRSIAVKTDN